MKKTLLLILTAFVLTACSSNQTVTEIYYNETDQEVSRTVETYNSKDQLIKTENGEDVTEYEYEGDSLIKMTSGDLTHEYIYNESGQLIGAVTLENGEAVEEMRAEYDENGNRATTTVMQDGKTFESKYTYNSSNQLVSITLKSEFTYYNASNQLVSAENEDMIQLFSYDEKGHEIEVVFMEENEEVRKIESEYENDQLIQRTTYNENEKSIEKFSYDDEQRVTEIQYYDSDNNYAGKTVYLYE